MPKKYVGLDVLQYERGLILDELIDLKRSFDALQDSYYVADYLERLKSYYTSRITVHEEKLQFIDSLVTKYSDGFDLDASYSSTEPLQEYYGKDIDELIDLFSQQIRDKYRSLSDSLLNSGGIFFSFASKKVARYLMFYFGSKSIVTEYLCTKHLEEIDKVASPSKKTLSAINHKYEFFRNSLVDCFPLIQVARNLD